MNIENAIKFGDKILKSKKIKSAKLDCEILLSKALKKDRKFVILNSEYSIKEESFIFFKNLIFQRSKGEPVAYLLGKKSFWNNVFEVSKSVLIPRPDTELLIEEVLKLYKHKKKQRVLDIGVGSGCIILSILMEKKDFIGVGIDISKKSIETSKINAFKLEINDRLKFYKSDVDNFNYGKYDLIVSNPPYISKNKFKYLEKDIINFEPKKALDGGIDGLFEFRKVIRKSSELIKKSGKLILEIGFDQKDKVTKILINNGFYINKVLKDNAKNNRCIVSTKI